MKKKVLKYMEQLWLLKYLASMDHSLKGINWWKKNLMDEYIPWMDTRYVFRISIFVILTDKNTTPTYYFRLLLIALASCYLHISLGQKMSACPFKALYIYFKTSYYLWDFLAGTFLYDLLFLLEVKLPLVCRSVRRLVCRLAGQSMCHNFLKGRNLHFHALIWAIFLVFCPCQQSSPSQLDSSRF